MTNVTNVTLHTPSIFLYVRIEGLSPFLLKPMEKKKPEMEPKSPAPTKKPLALKKPNEQAKAPANSPAPHLLPHKFPTPLIPPPDAPPLTLTKSQFYSCRHHIAIINEYISNILTDEDLILRRRVYFQNGRDSHVEVRRALVEGYVRDATERHVDEDEHTELMDEDVDGVLWAHEDNAPLDRRKMSDSDEQTSEESSQTSGDASPSTSTTTILHQNDGTANHWWDTDQFLHQSTNPHAHHIFLYEFRRGTQAHEYFSIQMQKRIHVYEWILDERQVNWTPDENSSMIPRIISLNRLFQFILLETNTMRDVSVTIFIRLFAMFFKVPILLNKLLECWEVPDLAEWRVRSSAEFHTMKRDASAESTSSSDDSRDVEVKSLDLLYHRSKVIPKIQARVLQLLHRWVTEEAPNLVRTEQIRDAFYHLLDTMTTRCSTPTNPYLSMIRKLRTLFDTHTKPLWERKSPSFCSQLFTNIPLSASKRVNLTSLLYHTPKEVAESLTLLDYMLYNRIEYFELTRQRWTKQKTRHQAPNLNASISFVNLLGNMVTFSILSQGDERKRKSAIKKWVLVIQELLQLNSLNVLMGIVGALGSASIHRLRLTWNLVKEKHLQTINTAKQITSSEGNFKNLRQFYAECHAQGKSVSPYIDFFLKDLILSDEGSPNIVDGKLNFSKAVRTHRIICGILRFQCENDSRGPFKHLRPNEDIVYMVEHYKTVDEDALYEMSLAAEERR